MAKRYHESKHGHRSHKSMNDGSYAGEQARRTQEMEDAGMLHEDRSAIANLPQNVMIKPYPKAGYHIPEELDDTISGIDRQMDVLDGGKTRADLMPKKV